MMDICIRAMAPEETETLMRYARQSFSLIERLGVSRPKMAVVAMVDGEIAGAVFLKMFGMEQKTGYMDLGFVRPEYRGKGVGNALYPAAIQALKDEGATLVAAMVKDDNVASWGLLKKQGFSLPNMVQLFRMMGFWNALSLWLNSLCCIASGMNMWISESLPEAKGGWEAAAFFCVNALLMTPYFVLRWNRGGWMVLGAFVVTLLVSMIAGFAGTRFSRGRNWRFRMNRGGFLVTLLIGVQQSFFPVMGRWYPAKYENTREFRRDMGWQALCEWIGVFLIALPGVFLDMPFFSILTNYGFTMIVLHMLAFFPFEYFGGGRVLGWNKVVFGIIALASLAFSIFA